MKKELRKRDDESLSEWIDRLCAYLQSHHTSYAELRDILRELSVVSYIAGSDSVSKIMMR